MPGRRCEEHGTKKKRWWEEIKMATEWVLSKCNINMESPHSPIERMLGEKELGAELGQSECKTSIYSV